jgi:hypothetical protein
VLLQHLGQDSCECAQFFRHGYAVSSSPCVSSSSSPAARVFLSNAVKALALSLSRCGKEEVSWRERHIIILHCCLPGWKLVPKNNWYCPLLGLRLLDKGPCLFRVVGWARCLG